MSRRDIVSGDETFSLLFTSKMTVDFKVFRLLMENGVSNNMSSSVFIRVKSNWKGSVDAKITK